MKFKVLKESTQPKHLKDVVHKIDVIALVDNINDYHFTTDETYDESLYESDDTDKLPEEDLLDLTDEQLLQLPKEMIHTFTNTELLDRLNSLDKTLLSPSQIEILRTYYKDYKVVIDKSDVEDFLSKLSKCSSVTRVATKKNRNFSRTFKFTDDEVLGAIKQLKASDYVMNRKDFSIGHIGDNLMVFEPSTIVIDGNVFKGLIIYIKIDVDESNDYNVVALSFHETNAKNKRPYA